MIFKIKNRWSMEVQFACELAAEFELKSYGIKLSAAIKKAIKAGADLQDAYLRGADLQDADLQDADLRDANLRDANLRRARTDLFDILLRVPNEIDALAQALRDGRVNGSAYEGDCACLVGTIANARKCSYSEIPNLAPESSRPAERWFLAIKEGNTPENSNVVKITLKWIEEFQWLLQAIRSAA